MRVYQQTVREGENVGPVEWTHPAAKDMPQIWREAERSPDAFELVTDNRTDNIHAICMYDGWPYWKPTPAIFHSGPLGNEWSFFNSYGVHPNSMRAKSQQSVSEPGA
jgi:hypothetical protein